MTTATLGSLVGGGIGWLELLILALLGLGALAVLGLLVFIAIKLAQPSK